MTQRYQLFIDNEWKNPGTDAWFSTEDPFSAEVWAEIPRAGPADVDAAVAAAKAALTGPWGKMTPTDRGRLLYRLGTLIEENAEHLARIEAKDNGKLLSEVTGQIRYAAKYFHYYAGLADKIEGAVIPIDRANTLTYSRYEPAGVVASITPWNSSLLLTVWKAAPALCGGNTFIAKPSEFTSASMFELAKLVVEAGLPKGVFNVLTGFGAEVGEPLVRHPDVACVAFTGGDQGGRAVARIAADGLKKTILELGGKSPNIVFDDADLDDAVNGVITGIFSAGGQSCMAGSRLLLQETIYDAFMERLLEVTKRAQPGDPSAEDTRVGPVATKPQFEKVMSYIDIANKEGARCLTGGRALTGPGYGAGRIVEPTIFVDVTNEMRIAQEEVFGPVLAVIKFKDEEDAIRIGNDIRFGLAAGVWTKNLDRAMLLSEKLQAGTVWVNNYRATSFTAPFGGFKQSGLGRENGLDVVKEFMEVKTVWISSNLKMPDPFVRKY